jgi:hypothetical protein
MPADDDLAATFVLKQGDAVERSVLNELEGGDVYDLPPNHEIERQVLTGQRADGGWASEDGPDRDPYVTVRALLALVRWHAI